ncbi:MAG: hypothetical protein LBR53_05905 [Deltaproteobacteria bacterium]|jgi:hypothetical protein|nr:hypothetical protein [Deltaproteobacteria bacterium]
MLSRIFPALCLPVLCLLSACTFDSREYDELKALKEEYLVRIAEARQANDTINRNINATYLELEALRTKLEEELARERPPAG